jgi:hypothetical protein
MNNLNWPCRCSHRLDEHDIRPSFTGDGDSIVGCCLVVTCNISQFQRREDLAIYQCKCYTYEPISNLEYLEKQYETNSIS